MAYMMTATFSLTKNTTTTSRSSLKACSMRYFNITCVRRYSFLHSLKFSSNLFERTLNNSEWFKWRSWKWNKPNVEADFWHLKFLEELFALNKKYLKNVYIKKKYLRNYYYFSPIKFVTLTEEICMKCYFF